MMWRVMRIYSAEVHEEWSVQALTDANLSRNDHSCMVVMRLRIKRSKCLLFYDSGSTIYSVQRPGCFLSFALDLIWHRVLVGTPTQWSLLRVFVWLFWRCWEWLLLFVHQPASLSSTPLWSMSVALTRLLKGSKAVMLSIAGCFFPRYS